jgi:hypothetical protein
MKLSKMIVTFFRMVLLAEVISFGIIIPKYRELETRIDIAYQKVLINLNKTAFKLNSSMNKELKYDLLKIKRVKLKKLF